MENRIELGKPFRRKLLSIALAACLGAGTAQAQPIGPQVISGSVNFASQGNALNITNSPNAIINWQGFSIAPNEVTRFIQQSGNSNVLNRVVGQESSAILGALQSNGRVYLINPNGILFGPNARVDVNGLIASTLDISNQDFLAGKYKFSAGSIAAKLDNQGAITTPSGGQIVLIAPDVQNSGILTSPQGEILLAAGKSVQLVDTANPDLAVVVSAPDNQALNLGQLIGQGGKVGIYGALINQRGKVSADSAVVGENGKILFKASKDTLLEAGSVTSATGAGKGGEIQVLGERVGLTGDAQVDASGQQGGGTVLVGGDYQGKNPAVQNAQVTYFGKDAAIKADAMQHGDGGKVIVWADDTTRAYGNISARGGQQGGNGGFVETSGHNYLDFQGRVDTLAPHGNAGTLLLDPADITIDNTTDNLNGGTIGGGYFSGATGNSTLTWNTINLQSGSLEIRTNSAGTGGNGDININANGTVTGPSTLTLLANNDIKIANGVSVSGSGDFNLIAGWNNTGWAVSSGTGNITLAAGSSLSGNNLTLSAGAGIVANGAVTGTTSANIHASAGAIGTGTTGLITAPSIDLQNDQTSIGAIGAAGTPFKTSSPGGSGNSSISIGTSGYGPSAVYVSHTGDATIASANLASNSPFSFQSTGNLVVSPAINTGTQDLTLSSGGTATLGITNDYPLHGANITLAADLMSIAGSGAIVGSGTVWLKPYSAGRSIDLGAKAGLASTFELSTNELDNVNAAALRIGSMAAGNLSISAAIAPSNASTLSLQTGGSVTQSGAGTVSATNLAIKALGNATLDLANSVTNLAALVGDSSHQNKNFIFKNTPALNVASGLDGINGISIVLDASGYTSSAPNGVISLTSGGLLSQTDNTSALLSGKAAYLEGSSVDFGSTTASNKLNPIGVIAGKATAGSTATFSYKSNSSIYVSTVRDATWADFSGISVSGATGPSAVKLNSPTSATSGVGQDTNAPIVTGGTGGLSIISAGGVNLAASTNSMNKLDVDLSGSTGKSVLFKNAGTFDIVALNAGTTSSSTKLDFEAVTGTLTASSAINAGTGIVRLAAPTLDLTTINVSAGNVALEADTLSSFTGTVTAASGADIRTYTAGRNITVGSATCNASPCLCVTNLWQVVSPTIAIGSDYSGKEAGAIYVAGITVGGTAVTDRHSTTTRIGLLTGAGITQGGAITVQDLGVSAAGAVNLNHASNAVTNLAGKTTGSSLTFVDSTTFNVTTMSGGTAPYNYSLSGIATSGGNVTLTASAGDLNIPGQINAGAGSVNLTASGGSVYGSATSPDIIAGVLDVSAYTNINGVSGLHTQVPRINRLNANMGLVNVLNFGGVILGPAVANSGTASVTALGNITVTAQSPITVNGYITSSNGGIGLTASSGSALTIDAPLTASSTISLASGSLAGSQGSSYSSSWTNNTPVSGGGTTPPPPPTLDQCIANPGAAGCSTVLPTLDQCTANPSAAGCSAVLPTLSACTANPSAAGCSAILPTLSACTANPSAAGCSAVLPTLSACTANPGAPGCSAILPTLSACTANPSAAGCSAVLPSISACAANPAAAGCSSVLPTLSACTANPSAAGCSAVLPTLAACTASPTAAGCSAVLPTLAQCTASPGAAGCSAVLPEKLPDVIKEAGKTDEGKSLDQALNQSNNSLNTATLNSVVKPLTTVALLSKETSSDTKGGGGGGDTAGRGAGSEPKDDKKADDKKDDKKDTVAQKEDKKDEAPKKKQYCN